VIHKPPESISSHFPDLFAINRKVFFYLPFLINAYFQGGVLSLKPFRSLGVVLNTLLEFSEQLGALSALYLCLGFVLQKVRNYGKSIITAVFP